MNQAIRILSLIAVLCCAVGAQAAAIFIPNGGTIDLQPNLAGQTFFIDVSGGELSNGTNLNVQIGDGGSMVGASPYGGTDGNKPVLTDVRTTITGLVFFGNNTGEPGIAQRVVSPYIGQTGTTSNPDPDMDPDTDDAVGVVLNGHLARVTVSTVGFPALPADQLFAVTPRLLSGPGVPPIDLPSQLYLHPTGEELQVSITGGFLRIAGTGGGAVDPAAVTATPANNAAVNAGGNVQVANAAAVAGRTRDDATVGSVAITQGLNGVFSLTGTLAGAVAAGLNRTGTVAFDDNGLLNGTQATAALDFSVTGGTTAGGTGLGNYHYNLNAVAAGNSGNLASVIAAGGTYGGLSGGSDKELGSTAQFLGGTNSGAQTTARMQWRARNANEKEPTGTSPPLPDFATELISDVLQLTGTDGDIQVLQINYNQALLNSNEAQLQRDGGLFLTSFDTQTGFWVNAVKLNHGANTGQTNVLGPWNGSLALGTWGVDTANNVVWAVIDHNSDFAAVPEPSTFVLAGMGAMVLAVLARRRRS